MKNRTFPFYRQLGSKDCGPTCLRIVAKYYGRTLSMERARELAETLRIGSSLLGLSNAAEIIGFKTLGVKISLEKLEEVHLPCILFWNSNHFVVLYKIKKKKYYISDPAHGLIEYSQKEFLKRWIGNNAGVSTEEGIVLILEPTPLFYDYGLENKRERIDFSYLTKYLIRYKSFLWQLVIGLLAGSFLQLIFPFLTQSVVDIGIKNQDINFVYLILFAQLSLFIGRTFIEIIRSWILLHLSTRINISLVSDFFIKLMKLPIAFFDTRMTGDILQRINDHRRIERIITTSSLNVVFSMFNLLIFGIVLAFYNMYIFSIFFFGSILYFVWITFFLKKRATLDYKKFSQISQEQSKVIELINGMQTIKLNNAEKKKRWGWEFLQVKLFKVSIEGLILEQYQNVGSGVINELRNILITAFSAKLVIDGEITLGMMLAISYIIGQMNSPVSQLIGFVRELQDAKISLERLAEIHNKKDEEANITNEISEIPDSIDFKIEDMTFRYKGAKKPVIESMNLYIPSKKITAIVGTSGSGKTTLMKILLKFYNPEKGEIKLGSYNLTNISQNSLRKNCGVVMQEDYIFNDSIANNIAVGVDYINKSRLNYASEIANIKEFVEELPLSFNTKIGMEGIGLSSGQKQRLLIARAVYKNPNCLFFDEATSALDANNEKSIMNKLKKFFENKTVVIIAHRLSTVRNAHQIVVLNKGRISEIGNHEDLIKMKGDYFNLVKNQLEL